MRNVGKKLRELQWCLPLYLHMWTQLSFDLHKYSWQVTTFCLFKITLKVIPNLLNAAFWHRTLIKIKCSSPLACKSQRSVTAISVRHFIRMTILPVNTSVTRRPWRHRRRQFSARSRADLTAWFVRRISCIQFSLQDASFPKVLLFRDKQKYAFQSKHNTSLKEQSWTKCHLNHEF